jgi:PAS domain S-box-containing protein
VHLSDDEQRFVQSQVAAVDRAIAPLGDALLAYDSDLTCLHFSAAMELMTGLWAHEVQGRPLFDLLPFLVDTGEDRQFKAALRGELAVSHDRPFEIPDTGRTGCYDAYYSPLVLGERIVGGLAILRDVTQARRAAQQTRESEMRFQSMADASPVLLWMSGTDGLCTFFNQTWLDYTGRSLEQEWGVGWAEGVHFEDLQLCLDTYMAAFNARQRFEMEYRLRRHDGEFRWILDRGAPRYTPDGTFAGYIGSCVDIDDRKRLEDELRRAVQARDEFLAIASHELKTPLTSLQLQLASLQRNRARAAGGRGGAIDLVRLDERIGVLDRQAKRMTRLVNDLLDVSRISGGRLELELQRLDLSALVLEVIDRFRDDMVAAQCPLHADITPGIVGNWDRMRLEQVVSNFLSNAIKYGRGRPLELSLRQEGMAAVLRVTDHGIGIAPEDYARIFERFGRAVSAQHYGGLGLGLWIVATVVEAMHGRVSVDSAVGRGSTFVAELPMDDLGGNPRPSAQA